MKRTSPRAIALALAVPALLVAASCGLAGEIGLGERKMMLVSWDPALNDGQYRLGVARVQTLRDVSTLQGDAAVLRAGARLSIDYDVLATIEQPSMELVAQATTVKEGESVLFRSFTAKDVIHPSDLRSLELATLYYNVERAQLFFSDLGAALNNVDVTYAVGFERGHKGRFRPSSERIEWDPVLHRLVVNESIEAQGLPDEMNLGAVGREYARAVLYLRLFGDEPIPRLMHRLWQDPTYAQSVNLASTLSVGLGDFFGALVSGDPAWMRVTHDGRVDERRLDVVEPRCVTAKMLSDLSDAGDDYDPVPLGGVLSAALWELWQISGDQRVTLLKELLSAMSGMGEAFRTSEAGTKLHDAVGAIIRSIDETRRLRACGVLLDRLNIREDLVPECAGVKWPELRCR